MHFIVAKSLSIAVMTYFHHFRNLRPANLLRTQLINFSMRPQDVRSSLVRMTRDHTVVWCLLSREHCTNLILPETRVPAEDFRRWQYVSIFISFHAIIFRMSHCPPSFIWFNRKLRHSIPRPWKSYPRTNREVDRMTVAEIWPFEIFQDGRRPPCWIC